MKVDLHYSNNLPFADTDLEQVGLGGTEGFIVQSARELARQGHQVRVYNQSPVEVVSNGVLWTNISRFRPQEDRDVLVSFRMREIFNQNPKGLKVIILADTESMGLGNDVKVGKIDLVMFVSQWHKDKIATEEGIPNDKCLVTSNGIKLSEYNRPIDKVPKVCIHTSTPERGLSQLLSIWPKIQIFHPDASLHLFSSFFGWGATPQQNQEMCRALYTQTEYLIKTGHNIVNHIHVGTPELREWQLRAELFLYPTQFKETFCISAAEAAAAGCVIVCSDVAALHEKAIDGVTGYLIPGDAGTDGHDWQFISKVNELMMQPEKVRQMSQTAREYAKRYDFEMLVKDWVKSWENKNLHC